jgi:hypothetical protein
MRVSIKKKKKPLPKYDDGGDLTDIKKDKKDLSQIPFAQITQPFAGMAQAASVGDDGRVNSGLAGLSGALSGGGMGAQLGSFAGPVGTAVGAGLGAALGGLTSLLTSSQRNEELNDQARKKKVFEDEMQLDKDNAILAAFPTKGVVGNNYYAKGGVLPPSVDPKKLKLITGVLQSQGLDNLAQATTNKFEKKKPKSLDELFAEDDASLDLSPVKELMKQGAKTLSTPENVATLINKARRGLGTPSKDNPTGDSLDSVLHGEEDPKRYIELVKKERYDKYNNNPPEDHTENYLRVEKSGHPLWNDIKKQKGAEIARSTVEARDERAKDKEALDDAQVALRFAYEPSVYGERTSYDDAVDINTVEDMKKTFKNSSNLALGGNLMNTKNKFLQFALGGKLPKYLEGGEMQPLAEGVQQANGATHEEGGIEIPDSTGQPLAEIEDKEVVKDGQYVFSDRLPVPGTNETFADIAARVAESKEYKKLTKVREEADEVLSVPTNGFHYKNTATRNLEKNPDPLDALFQMQEQLKQMQMQMQQAAAQEQQPANGQPPEGSVMPDSGIPIAAGGMDLGKLTRGIGAAAPFMDNITNAMLTAKTPVIPTPNYTKAPQLDTTIEIGASLADMNRQAQGRDKNILANTNQSSTARANLLAGNVNDVYAKNQLFQQKEQGETQLHNQASMAEYENRFKNTQKLDQFEINKMMRTDDIHSRISANVSDASENIQLQTSEARKETLDKQKMSLLMMQYLNTGVLERSGFDKVMEVIEKGGSISEAMAMLKEFKNPTKEVDKGISPLSSIFPTMYKKSKDLMDAFGGTKTYRTK